MSASETPQPRQPAHDARPVVRRAVRGDRAGAAGRRAGQRLAVVRVRLPDGRRRARGRGARLVRRASSTNWARAASRCATPPAWPIPTQVAALTRAFRERWPGTELTLHFHNTRGMGLANVLAAIDAGADRFDASLGGIGGCPYAPGASGNVCSEEIVHALELMGYDTGVDLARLLGAAQRLPALIGHDIPSQIVKAGRRLDLHRAAGRFRRDPRSARSAAPDACSFPAHQPDRPERPSPMPIPYHRARRFVMLPRWPALPPRGASAQAPPLPDQADHADRAHRPGRHHRHRRAHAGRAARQGARPDHRGRQPRRRQRRHRARWPSSAPSPTATRC